VLHGGFCARMGRGLTMLVNVATLPLTLRYLGQLEYGIWVTISTSVVMLPLSGAVSQ
jgi:O-antigen/teichoic acid export membrane protein